MLLSPHPAFVENAGVASHPRWPKDNRTAGRGDSAVGGKRFEQDFWEELLRKGLPLQQNHFLPCYIRLQQSAGEKGGGRSSAKTDIRRTIHMQISHQSPVCIPYQTLKKDVDEI